jgi:hypothetical protein
MWHSQNLVGLFWFSDCSPLAMNNFGAQSLSAVLSKADELKVIDLENVTCQEKISSRQLLLFYSARSPHTDLRIRLCLQVGGLYHIQKFIVIMYSVGD